MSSPIIGFFTVIIVLLIAAVWQMWVTNNFDYQCENCGQVFSLSAAQSLLAPHMMGKKLVRCPNCGRVSWASPVRK